MKWFLAIPLILIGAILLSLTIDQMGAIGHIVMKTLGGGSIIVASLIVRGKKKNLPKVEEH